MNKILVLESHNPDIPDVLRKATEETRLSRFRTVGNVKILDNTLLGLLCSIRCPGRVIVQTYDLARALRDEGITVIAR